MKEGPWNITCPVSCKSFYISDKMDEERFKALCRGQELRPLSQVGKLKCHLTIGRLGDPYLLLQPIKVEELNKEHTGLWMIHDVISPREMDTVKKVGARFVSKT